VVDTSESKGRRARRRGRPRREGPQSPVEIIARAKPPVDTSKPADVPLTAAEAAEMRVHFRFLKEHRKALGLKVNAAEDLLLNGAREPVHRGVCQHLLAKVERRRVELAVERLDPAAAARLLEGIIRFSPDVTYLLLYLETLRAAARPDAPAALAEALKHIDFAAVSAAQMRRVLELIVELLDARDRPQLLFSLLQSRTFQAAFDKSAESLPGPLAEIVIPLRAAHAVIVRGAANPHGAADLARGVGMLLASHEKVLRAQAAPVRQRLFDLGLELSKDGTPPVVRGLSLLLDGFPRDDRSHSERALALAKWLLASGREAEAKSLLGALVRDYPGFRVPARWLDALTAPRVGGIALSEGNARAGDRERFLSGLSLGRQLPVWLRLGTRADLERYRETAELFASLAVPGVASLIEHGVAESGEPYLAVPKLGRGLNEVVLGRAGLALADALSIAGEIVRIVAALAELGVALPDVRYRRFSCDESGRVWLRDLGDAERVAPDAARARHTALATELCLDVLGRVGVPFPDQVLSRLRAAESCVALARALENVDS
jgi:hypothetical protein